MLTRAIYAANLSLLSQTGFDCPGRFEKDTGRQISGASASGPPALPEWELCLPEMGCSVFVLTAVLNSIASMAQV